MNMLARLSIVSGCAVIAGIAICTVAAAESSGAPELFRSDAGDGADRPTGRLLLRVKAKEDESAPTIEPPVEPGEPPVEPNSPETGTDDDSGSDWYGKLGGATLFVLDVSVSMNAADMSIGENMDGDVVAGMTRLDALKGETIRSIRKLGDNDMIDFVLLAGCVNGARHGGAGQQCEPVTDVWQGHFVPCDEAGRVRAIEFVKNMTAWYGTPTYRALKRACTEYGTDIDTLIFLSDGVPYPGRLEDGKQHIPAIFAEFPAWYAPIAAHGCKLKCIHIGQEKPPGYSTTIGGFDGASRFMSEFAARNNGEYKHVE